jgi:hypothetical protein
MTRFLRPITIWVILSAALSAAGWLLSLCRQLNAVGYLIVFMVCAAGAIRWVREINRCSSVKRFFICPRLRFNRALPILFFTIAVLAILGGCVHPPNNYDALSYRIPRMLNWLAEGQWHWIHTANARMNDRACGFEWLAMPLLVFTKTDRFIFLINGISYLLLPGLIFSLFTRLGIARRVAWSWMWILPSGYVFALQAGSASNDMFTVPYALAAIDFALRARQTGRRSDAWLSLLAASLMTGAKGTTLALMLPWAFAFAPSWRLLFERPLRSAVVVCVSFGVSFLPTAIANHIHCGDWSGTKLETVLPPPLESIVGNTVQLVWQNFTPPVMPAADFWNAQVLRCVPSFLRERLLQTWEQRFWEVRELPVEDWSALGLGISVLALVALCFASKKTKATQEQRIAPKRNGRFIRVLIVLPWISLIVYMAKVGLPNCGRLIAPYYIFLFPLILRLPSQDILVRRCWWKFIANAIVLIAIFVVIANSARPLWPAQLFFRAVMARKPTLSIAERGLRVYGVYANRNDALSPVRHRIPDGVGVAGLVSKDDPEASLWRPFGLRRIVHVLPSDTRESVRRRKIEYVILSPDIEQISGLSLESWLQSYKADLIAEVPLTHRASKGTQLWRIARMEP